MIYFPSQIRKDIFNYVCLLLVGSNTIKKEMEIIIQIQRTQFNTKTLSLKTGFRAIYFTSLHLPLDVFVWELVISVHVRFMLSNKWNYWNYSLGIYKDEKFYYFDSSEMKWNISYLNNGYMLRYFHTKIYHQYFLKNHNCISYTTIFLHFY